MYRIVSGILFAVLVVIILSTAAHADVWDDDLVIDDHSFRDDFNQWDIHNSYDNWNNYNTYDNWNDYDIIDNWDNFNTRNTWNNYNGINNWDKWQNDYFTPGDRLIEFHQPRTFDLNDYRMPTYRPVPIYNGTVFDRIKQFPKVEPFKIRKPIQSPPRG